MASGEADDHGLGVSCALSVLYSFLMNPFSLRYSVPATVAVELTTMVSLGLDDFVIGTNDGGVFRCWNLGQAASERSSKRQLQLLPLRRHRFMVSTLLRTEMDGHQIVISCDLSGQAYYHDMRHEDEVYTYIF